jgi:hypothetical protein
MNQTSLCLSTRTSASGSWSSCFSSPRTCAPNQARTVDQTNEPSRVMVVKTPKPMRAAPAGSETRCRTTGRRREKKMPAAEYWWIQPSASSHFFSGTNT